jgi:hypothetical protein
MRRVIVCIAVLLIAVPAIRWVAKPNLRPEYDKDGRVIIEWYNYATPEFLELYEKYLIPGFEKTHKNIKIRLNSSLGDTGYDAKLLTRFRRMSSTSRRRTSHSTPRRAC